MTNADLVQTYVDLLIIEYSDPNNQPNALATIALLANEAIANQVIGQVGAGFALSMIYGQTIAQGTQLNILAQFVGAQRTLPGYAPSLTYYGFEDASGAYDPTIGGMGDVTVGPPMDFWIIAGSPSAVGSYTLTDGEMLLLIRYLAAVNNAYLSVAEVDNILFEFFASYATVTESAPMQITYADSGSDPGTLYGIVKFLNAFPHPSGVQVID